MKQRAEVGKVGRGSQGPYLGGPCMLWTSFNSSIWLSIFRVCNNCPFKSSTLFKTLGISSEQEDKVAALLETNVAGETDKVSKMRGSVEQLSSVSECSKVFLEDIISELSFDDGIT